MTVYELIQQLQDCDKPDAIVRVSVAVPRYGKTDSALATDVFYESVASGEVVIEAQVQP